MTRRLPNFLYIGPDKAGSTWLHEVLVNHPEIYLTPAKDLYYFDRYFGRGEEWYQRHFADVTDQRVVGEVCQDYLSCAESPARIATTLGRPKMMATLRDPVERAYSSYLYMRKHGEGPDSFSEALRTKPTLLDHGRYGTQLKRYADMFGRACLHVAVFDDLQENPQAFVDSVLEWLGVSPMVLPEEDLKSKLPASRARFVPAAWAVRQGANVVRALDGAQLVGRVKRSPRVQRLLYQPVPASDRQISAEDATWIREQLRSDIEAAESLFSLNLMERWGW
ncbi:sulfotransferase [Ornithinimicrobium faecis]|uniref:Sulfotransferase n=2 Tax=Ornithinimicrobium faecis TaxID=2934158 RepID=A0ABY4YUP2_9MICO|nr:sulfotransferase domain-containing protein [Ornithinimicrobium sp. HY1793]USQ80453.1 sulfotransferase [Ornithinimicrobium sp. HY1793]